MPIIIGLLVFVVLPPLLGALIWWLLPQSIKDLITSLIGLGIMFVVMWLMTSMMKPLAAPKKPKRLEEAKK